MGSTENNYSITSKLGIATVLRSIQSQNIMVHVSVGGYEQALITNILDINPDNATFIIDASSDKQLNIRLVRPGNIHFSAVVDRIRVQFSLKGPAKHLLFEQRSAYQMPFPEALQRIQRRDHYRIDLPVSTPLMLNASIENKTVTFKAKDLSAGGIALYDPNNQLSSEQGHLYKNCTLNLEDLGTINVTLMVKRIAQEGDPTNPRRVVGCEFINLSNHDLIRVQNYLGRVERLINARLKGFDL